MSDSKSTSTLGLVEGKLLRLFQNDFLTMLQVFRYIFIIKVWSFNILFMIFILEKLIEIRQIH